MALIIDQSLLLLTYDHGMDLYFKLTHSGMLNSFQPHLMTARDNFNMWRTGYDFSFARCTG